MYFCWRLHTLVVCSEMIRLTHCHFSLMAVQPGEAQTSLAGQKYRQCIICKRQWSRLSRSVSRKADMVFVKMIGCWNWKVKKNIISHASWDDYYRIDKTLNLKVILDLSFQGVEVKKTFPNKAVRPNKRWTLRMSVSLQTEHSWTHRQRSSNNTLHLMSLLSLKIYHVFDIFMVRICIHGLIRTVRQNY